MRSQFFCEGESFFPMQISQQVQDFPISQYKVALFESDLCMSCAANIALLLTINNFVYEWVCTFRIIFYKRVNGKAQNIQYSLGLKTVACVLSEKLAIDVHIKDNS